MVFSIIIKIRLSFSIKQLTLKNRIHWPWKLFHFRCILHSSVNPESFDNHIGGFRDAAEETAAPSFFLVVSKCFWNVTLLCITNAPTMLYSGGWGTWPPLSEFSGFLLPVSRGGWPDKYYYSSVNDYEQEYMIETSLEKSHYQYLFGK